MKITLTKYEECKKCKKYQKRVNFFEAAKKQKTRENAIFINDLSIYHCNCYDIDENSKIILEKHYDITHLNKKPVHVDIPNFIFKKFLWNCGGVWQFKGNDWYINLYLSNAYSYNAACKFIKENYKVRLNTIYDRKPEFKILL